MRRILILPCLLLLLLGACSAPRKTIYFTENNGADTGSVTVTKVPESTIQPDDILAITVTSVSSLTLDKDPVAIFREGGTTFSATAQQAGVGGAATAPSTGFLVDGDGYIDFPVVGRIQLAGMTIRQAKEILAQRLKKIVTDPVVEIRITNFKVSVLGEVARPGFVLAPNHKITVLEALAAAGDIPISGRKDNILVIREENGVQQRGRLNLNDVSAFRNPYFYLKQNDIVYVEPNRVRRQQTNDFTQIYLPIVSSVLTSLLAVYGIIQVSR